MEVMAGEAIDKGKVVKLLQFFPEIDGEIRTRKNILSDLDQYYDTSKAINYDGMPHAKYNVTSPTETAAFNVPDFVSHEIRKYEAQIEELQRVKVEIIKEVSRLKLKQKNVIFGFYFHDMKWEQVAKRTNYSERQCKNIRDEALEKLLEWFKKNKVLAKYEIKE